MPFNCVYGLNFPSCSFIGGTLYTGTAQFNINTVVLAVYVEFGVLGLNELLQCEAACAVKAQILFFHLVVLSYCPVPLNQVARPAQHSQKVSVRAWTGYWNVRLERRMLLH